MKKKYAFHPNNYAIGATEKFYSEMAAKGWELENHGAYLSKFKKAEPKRTLYRVELIPQKFFPKEDEQIPNREQLAIFKDCGWTYVSGASYVHVFSAPEGTNAPEFYLEPEQQAPIVKKVRNFNIIYLLIFSLYFIISIFPSFLFNSFTSAFSKLYYSFIDLSAAEFFLYLITILLSTIILYYLLYEVLKLNSLYLKLKKGVPIDHSPTKIALRIPVLLITAILCLVCLTVSLFIPENTYSEPPNSNVPYITLSDIGFEAPEKVRHSENEIEYTESFLAEIWRCNESVLSYDDEYTWMNQYIFCLKYDFMCESFAEALMTARTSAESTSEFTEIEIPGLDHAWAYKKPYCIVVKDNYVYFIIHHYESEEEMMNLLYAIAELDYE